MPVLNTCAPTQRHHQFSHLRGKLSSVAKTFTVDSPRVVGSSCLRPSSSSSPRRRRQDEGYGGRPILSPRSTPTNTTTTTTSARMFGSGALRPQSAASSALRQRLPPTSPRHSQTGSVFNVQLRDALYSCTSGMSCLLNACERYIESIDVAKLLAAGDGSPTLEEERSQPLSSQHQGDGGETSPSSSSSSTTSQSNSQQFIKKAVAAFILDVGALKKLHVDESCHAVLTILSQTAISSNGRPSSSSSVKGGYLAASSRPPSAASRPPSSASTRHVPPSTTDDSFDKDIVVAEDSPLTWGLVASQLFIVRLRESISCLRSGSLNVHNHTSPETGGVEDGSGKGRAGTGAPIASKTTLPTRPTSACPAPPLWSRRSSSSSSIATSSATTTTNSVTSNSSVSANRQQQHLPRGLVQLQTEASGVMESLLALQSLVDGMCDRDQETSWIRGYHKFNQQLSRSKSNSTDKSSIATKDGDGGVTEFIAAVNSSIFPRSSRWVPSLERQAAAAAAIAACTSESPQSSTTSGPTPIRPVPPPPPSQQHQQQREHAPSRPSTGYTRFRQVPLGSGGGGDQTQTNTTTGSHHQPLSSSASTTTSAVVKLAPLDTVLSLDNKQWLTLTRNGSVSLRDLIDGKCVPWPTNCLLRVCDEIGLPRDVVLKVRASHIPKDKQQQYGGCGGVSKSVPSDVRAAIVRYLKILQRRWHPDRFHHALGGGGGATQSTTTPPQTSSSDNAVFNLYAPEPSDDDEDEFGGGRGGAENAVLAQATLIAQSINAIRDAIGDN